MSTTYLPLGWDEKAGSIWSGYEEVPHELVELGQYGRGKKGSVETNQYSVTSHKRNLMGGSDVEDGHKERIHARGGIPGVFFVSIALCFYMGLRLRLYHSRTISPL